MSARSRQWPAIEELRAVCQPVSIRSRRSAEHWSADLYWRRVSPYLTRVFLRLGFSADAVTWLMIGVGWTAAAALLLPGMGGAVLAALFAQLQMLVDACDGEVARWRRTSSPRGIFLDKVGHYTTESFIPIVLGIRAAGGLSGLDSAWRWAWLGAVLAVLVVVNKALNDMVHVARAFSGMPRLSDTAAATEPAPGLVARLRRLARFVPFHRVFHSVEFTLIALAAAVLDLVMGGAGVGATRVALAVLVPAALLAVLGHTASILSSSRVRSE